jgi:hypothetical protein
MQRSTAHPRLQISMSFKWHTYALKVRATQGGFFQLALEQVCGSIVSDAVAPADGQAPAMMCLTLYYSYRHKASTADAW